MALLSNSCFCNSRVITTSSSEGLTPAMDIRTQVHVKVTEITISNLISILDHVCYYLQAGTELNFSYNHLMMGCRSRRESFRQVWFFDCKCARCCDATEMGSFLNGLLCPLCPANERGEFFRFIFLVQPKGPSINYVVLVEGGRGSPKDNLLHR